LARFKSYHEQDSGNIQLILQVADLHYQLGEFDEAREVLQKGIDLTEDPGLYFRLSNVEIASSHFDEAIAALHKIQELGVDNPAVHYNLGYALMFKGDFQNATEQLEPLSEIGDQSVERTPVLLARCYHHLGQLERAIELGTQYVQKHPSEPEALGVLALLNYDSEHEQEAVKFAKKALENDTFNLEARIVLGSAALGVQDEDKAKKHFDKALERHPTSGRVWSGKGLTDMLSLDINHALTSLQKAVKYMPNHIGTWHALAWCQILANDLEGAKASLNKAMDIDHNFGETHGGLAVIAAMQGDREGATKMARRAVLLNPESFAGRFAQSLLVKDTDPEKAQDMIKQIMASKAGADSDKTLTETLMDFMKNKSKKLKH
jgi:tetratricopeptide (TPR) repeat protein